MILERLSASDLASHEQESADWKCYGTNASISFPRFGNGPENFSHFCVRLTWEDIEVIVEAMAAKGHEGAMRVQNALRLADAVKSVS